MEAAERKDFRKPDEVRQFPKGRLELIKIGGAMVGRAVFEPGGAGPPRSSRSSRRRAARPRTSSTMSPGAANQDGRWHRVRLQAGRRVAVTFRA